MNSIPVIVTQSDENYLRATKTLLTSILCNYSEKFKFYIHHAKNSISETSKKNFLNTFNNKKCEILFVTSKKLDLTINSGLFEDYNLRLNDFFTVNKLGKPQNRLASSKTFFKLWISDSVPENKVIFLDSDTFVFRNFEKLINYPADVKLAAVNEWWPFSFPDHASFTNKQDNKKFLLFHEHFLMPQPSPYFNSGVMIADLSAWRQLDIIEKSIEFIKKYLIIYPDQDILNYFFHTNFYHLPAQFNLPYSKDNVSAYFFNFVQNKNFYNKFSDISPIIVHFVGQNKPIFDDFSFTNDNIIRYYNSLKRGILLNYLKEL